MVRTDLIQILDKILTQRIKQDFNIDKQSKNLFKVNTDLEHIGLQNLIGHYDETFTLEHHNPVNKAQFSSNKTQQYSKPYEFGKVNLRYTDNGVDIITKLCCGKKIKLSIPQQFLDKSNEYNVMGEHFVY